MVWTLRASPDPMNSMASNPELSIVIPAFDEGRRLRPTLEAVLDWLDREGPDAEVVVVDDGSADETPEILADVAGRDPRLRALTHPVNRGKGGAVRTGVEAARGRRVIFFDADLSYPLDHVHEALERLAAGADVVLGSRLADSRGGRADYPWVRRAASAGFGALAGALLGLRMGDTQCGFKAFRAEAAKPLFRALTVEGFGFDAELVWLARRWGLAVEVMPVAMTHRAGGSVAPVRHGLGMARDLVRIRLRAARGGYPEGPPSPC